MRVQRRPGWQRRLNWGSAWPRRWRSSVTAISQVAPPPHTHAKYERLIARAKQVPPATTAVVHPCDETSLRGATEAAEAGLIVPILVGPAGRIGSVARQHDLDI